MRPRDYFDELTTNALEFIEKSFLEFRESPKYSLIDFYTGIEILLKARLLREHWSLIINKPETASIKRFEKGDFGSVGTKEAINRLVKIGGEEIHPRFEAAIDRIRTHRNTIVHFVNTDFINQKEEEITRIAQEQINAWYFLSGLLLGPWDMLFNDHLDKIQELNEKAKVFKEYLGAKYEFLKPQIEKLIAEGNTFNECSVCGFPSARIVHGPLYLQRNKCLVCGHEGSYYMEITCKECGEKFYFYGDDEDSLKCDECGEVFSIEELLDELDPAWRDDDQAGESRAFCSDCGHYEYPTVISDGSGEIQICLWCLAIWDEGDITQCGYCGERNAGIDPVDAIMTGCVVCDGQDLD